MTKKEQLIDMEIKNKGYLFTGEVTEAGISRTYLAKYLKANHFERAAYGIYYSEDTWLDELFVIQKSHPILIFGRETALYFHGLMDREYSRIHVSVPKNYNTFRLKEKGMVIHSYEEELYRMGNTYIESGFGNILKIYDKERCICDIVAQRNDVEVQTFQTAMKEYMGSVDKKLDILLMYADKLGLRDEIMKYVEVMI